MRAAVQFVEHLRDDRQLPLVARIQAQLFGSPGATGRGHGSDKAVLLGLSGERPELCDPRSVEGALAQIRLDKELLLLGQHKISFDETSDLVMHRRQSLPLHPNGMTFTAYDGAGQISLAVMPRDVGQSGDWWATSDGGVGTVVIVEVEPVGQVNRTG